MIYLKSNNKSDCRFVYLFVFPFLCMNYILFMGNWSEKQEGKYIRLCLRLTHPLS
nr:MAG TPA: hypothetical protein [Caudoviricetes sp.]